MTASISLSLPSVLRLPSIQVFTDYTVNAPSADRYYAELETQATGEILRLSISSWQATIQLDRADFLQVVVPGLSDDLMQQVLAQIDLGDQHLSVYRKAGNILRRMVRVDLDAWYQNEGPRRATLTLSGYGRDVIYEVPLSSRNVTGVRTLMQSSRGSSVRCNIDWLLEPGMEAVLPSGAIIQVSYINYYVSISEAWMQIGERD